MPVRTTILSLIPKHYYRTSVQRQIRCCGVLLQEPKKKENFFKQVRDEYDRWQEEEKQGKTWAQFKKELEERHLGDKELEERQSGDKELEKRPPEDEELEKRPSGDKELEKRPSGDEELEKRPPGDKELEKRPYDNKVLEERQSGDKELEERKTGKKESEERPTDGKEVETWADKIKYQFETKLPRFSALFFTIRDGLSDLCTDFMAMVRLYFQLWRGKREINDFNLRELELLYEIYVQVKSMVPIFFVAVMPLGNMLFFTAAYLRPLRFLTPHFWTDEQKLTSIKQQHASRVAVFLPIIQYLEINLPEETNSNLVSAFRDLLLSIQEGKVPSPTELAAFRTLFGGEQIFAMGKLSSSHLDNLLTLHGQRGLLLKTTWLDEWASYLHLVDRFVRRNGGVTSLSSEQLSKYCFQRGANANAMTEEEMQDYMKQWMAFSENVSSDYIPLLLHAPALIGFNHKSNHAESDDSDQCDDSLS